MKVNCSANFPEAEKDKSGFFTSAICFLCLLVWSCPRPDARPGRALNDSYMRQDVIFQSYRNVSRYHRIAFISDVFIHNHFHRAFLFLLFFHVVFLSFFTVLYKRSESSQTPGHRQTSCGYNMYLVPGKRGSIRYRHETGVCPSDLVCADYNPSRYQ